MSRSSKLKGTFVRDRQRMNSLCEFYLAVDNTVVPEIPNVIVREGDVKDSIVFQTTEHLENIKPDVLESPRKRFLFLRIPNRWSYLSVVEILKRLLFSRQNVAVIISVIVHLIIVFILISCIITVKVGILGNSTTLSFSKNDTAIDFTEDTGDVLTEELAVDVLLEEDFEQTDVLNELTSYDENNRDVVEEFAEVNETLISPNPVESLESSREGAGGIPFYSNKGITQSRTRERNVSPGKQGDVTKESEDAVERGLQWLARHQLPDGGWAFDLKEFDSNERSSACSGCTNSFATSGGSDYKTGLHPSRMAATAIAILPFLGAGYTHTEPSKYQNTVASGIRYLLYNAVISSENGVDFRAGFTQDGASYVQALAVLTCCEAYEMTHDPNLRSLAQGGLKKIEDSQLDDGGWRYFSPGDLGFHSNVPGDTSVLGWQVMALKSGISAGFMVRPSVAYRANSFLDLVMSKDAKSYRYQPGSTEKKNETWGTTAVGVLSREYFGWKPGNPQLEAGIKQIADWIDDADLIWQKVKKGSRTGSSRKGAITYFRDERFIYNLYFSYYASLALHNYGGTVWDEKFKKIRDFLVESQSRGGISGMTCEGGSWLFYDRYMNDGGRLLNTSLAILILETPYRYLPMYRR